MEMLLIGICDDNKKILDFLEKTVRGYLNQNKKKHEIIACDSGQALLDEKVIFDVVFLDIELGKTNDFDGIQLGWKLRDRSKQTKIIFVTGHEEYRLAAQEMHCFYYLSKPVTSEKVCRQLKDVIEYTGGTPVIVYLETEEGYIAFNVDDILYFYYVANKTIEVVTRIKRYTMRANMKDLACKMEKYDFALSHQAYLVNLKNIKRPYARHIQMMNDEEIPLAERRVKSLKEAFFKLVYEKKDDV